MLPGRKSIMTATFRRWLLLPPPQQQVAAVADTQFCHMVFIPWSRELSLVDRCSVVAGAFKGQETDE